MTKRKNFSDEFNEALEAGARRDYKTAINLLESLAARGFAEPSGNKAGHPEIYLYLARSWHALKQYAKAVASARLYVRLRPEDGSGWFFLGRSFLADGAVDRAVAALRRSLDIKPDSADARVLLGTALLKKGRAGAARKIFEDAVSLQPDDKKLQQGYFNALFVEAVKHFKRGNAELARQMLTFLINNDLDGVAPRLYLAHALRALGYYPEALEVYEAAQSFAPDDVSIMWYAVSIYIDMGETEKAAELMLALGEAGAAQEQISQQFVSLRIVKNYLDAGAWAKAVYAGRNYIKAFGDDSPVHALMGEAQRNLGNPKNAVNHFNIALRIDPADPAPYYGLMLAHSDARNWRALKNLLPAAEACGCDAESVGLYRVLCDANLNTDPVKLLPQIQEAVRRNGVMPCLLLALARTYSRLGLSELAAGWYQKVLHLDALTKLSAEEREEAMQGLFATCQSTGNDAALLETYRTFAERWEVSPALRKECIRLLAEKKMWEQAAEETERLLRYEDDAFYSRQLAKFRRNAGQYRQAAVLYRNMLRSKPDDRNLHANLVFCLDRMGERTAAVNLMHETNRIFSPTANSLLIEARLHLNAGKTDRALEVFLRVTELFADDVRGWTEAAAIYRKKGMPAEAERCEQKAEELKKLREKAKRSEKKKRPRPSAISSRVMASAGERTPRASGDGAARDGGASRGGIVDNMKKNVRMVGTGGKRAAPHPKPAEPQKKKAGAAESKGSSKSARASGTAPSAKSAPTAKTKSARPAKTKPAKVSEAKAKPANPTEASSAKKRGKSVTAGNTGAAKSRTAKPAKAETPKSAGRRTAAKKAAGAAGEKPSERRGRKTRGA